MIVLVRDEDVPTVVEALKDLAEESGLSAEIEGGDEEGEGGAQGFDLFAMLSPLRAMLTESAAGVVIADLDSVGPASATWAAKLSVVCETEILVFDAAESGLRVEVYEDGALDEGIDVALDPSGTTRSAALAELTDSEEGASELKQGIRAANDEELFEGLLRCFDVPTEGEDWIAVSFRRSNETPALGEPGLLVSTPLESLEGAVGSAVGEPYGNSFSVGLSSGDAVEGVRFEVTGDALALVTVERVVATLRVRGGVGLEQRELVPDAVSDDTLAFVVSDAFLESEATGRPPRIDQNDLFSAVQQLVRATETLFVNRLDLALALTGRQAGQGELVVRVSALSGPAAPGELALPVLVRA